MGVTARRLVRRTFSAPHRLSATVEKVSLALIEDSKNERKSERERKELREKGYDIPEYPEEPKNDEEKALQKKLQLSNETKYLVLTKGNVPLVFDYVMKTPRSSIASFEAKTCMEEAKVRLEEGKTYKAKEIHKALGHANP